MHLPGGLCTNGKRLRNFGFKPLTGQVELELAMISESEGSTPVRVSAALTATLEHIGELEPTFDRIGQLCVADRQFLMYKLAEYRGLNEIWITGLCEHCGESFDVLVNLSELPIEEASEGFPYTEVQTSVGVCRLRLPTGNDQSVLAAIDDMDTAIQLLLQQCAVHILNKKTGKRRKKTILRELRQKDVAKIESAFEKLSPYVVRSVATTCPECDNPNTVPIDPYFGLTQGTREVFSEIHVLATHYHWNEDEILSLPSSRRRLYLSMINQSRDMLD
jgi:hypothetical protein